MAGRPWPRNRRGSTDEALIRTVYEEHGGALLAYATRLTGDRAAAEDVVQETLIRAWRHSDALANGKGSVRGWLLTVARNIITDRYRAKAARPAEVAGSPATPPTEEDHADSVVDTMTVLGALDRLSPEHRDVLTELYYRERSVAEAARNLGIPEGTVKSRSYYALRALRAGVAEDPDGAAAATAARAAGNDRSGGPRPPAGFKEVVA
ncbi:sigma-70 family RNA polymerase sigma factor [Streptomyces sp. NPDC097619]|uniref:sigma-70 family RNA polymerase sigma factor n=1 Tax=Streptomyces sp. NPDC097619 TaxID=3157228 RepID=UPI003320121A